MKSYLLQIFLFFPDLVPFEVKGFQMLSFLLLLLPNSVLFQKPKSQHPQIHQFTIPYTPENLTAVSLQINTISSSNSSQTAAIRFCLTYPPPPSRYYRQPPPFYSSEPQFFISVILSSLLRFSLHCLVRKNSFRGIQAFVDPKEIKETSSLFQTFNSSLYYQVKLVLQE